MALLECARCLMNDSDPEIVFDSRGICNHCLEFEERKSKLPQDEFEKKRALQKQLDQIKAARKGKRYDCIVGVSGGVDSSYVALLAKRWGLNPLLIHLDNGWNSELSVSNIEKLVNFTGFDLYTRVLNWQEFRRLQRSFFDADVIDLELLTDHAIFATLYEQARKNKVKYILSGENFETEAILPLAWVWRKTDARNIKAISAIYGNAKIRDFPLCGTLKRAVYQFGGFAQSIPILNLLSYDKEKAIAELENEVGWVRYSGKHYESVFTRFYQGVILPKKFSVDKRIAHLSTLINSGQLSRRQAELLVSQSDYPEELQRADRELVCKKLSFSDGELESYLQRPGKPHSTYATDTWLYNSLKKIYKYFGMRKHSKYA